MGLENGELRVKMQEEGFDLLITADKNISFQQNMKTLPFTVLVIDTPSMEPHYQLMFAEKIERFLKKPPSPMPKVVFAFIGGVSIGKKIIGLQRLIPPHELLII